MGIIERFLNYLSAEKQYSKLTVDAYHSDIRQFLLYIGITEESFELNTISSTELRSFVMHLKSEGLRNSSVNRKISTLKSLYKFGLRCGDIILDPTSKLSLLKRERVLPAFVTESDMKLASGNFMLITDDFIRERDTLMFMMIYATGVRISELIAMKIEDISFVNCEIKVTGKGNKQRIVPLVSILIKKMHNYLNLCDKIFCFQKKSLFLSKKGSNISRTEAYRVINQLLKDIGVEGKCSPHVLRHTFATHLLNNGAGIESVRELLGHASLAATQIYTHNNIGILVEKYKNAHPRAKNNNKI